MTTITMTGVTRAYWVVFSAWTTTGPPTQKEDTMTNASTYAIDVADQIVRLCSVVEYYGTDVNPAVLRDLIQYEWQNWDSEQLADDLRWLESYLGDDDYECALRQWLDGALDIWATVQLSFGGIQDTDSSVTVLVTCGGPRCEIIWDGCNGVAVHVWWGTDHAVERRYCPPLARLMSELLADLLDTQRVAKAY